MLNILANSFMIATRTDKRHYRPVSPDKCNLRWHEKYLPFRDHAGHRTGYDD